ncbi:MAG TPA: hypothetical protein DD811_00570 [Syntrophomonas sp.]|nr:hypothetical protein [Syntrophomonas sp.]
MFRFVPQWETSLLLKKLWSMTAGFFMRKKKVIFKNYALICIKAITKPASFVRPNMLYSKKN